MGEQSLPFVTLPHTRNDPSEIQNVPDSLASVSAVRWAGSESIRKGY